MSSPVRESFISESVKGSVGCTDQIILITEKLNWHRVNLRRDWDGYKYVMSPKKENLFYACVCVNY